MHDGTRTVALVNLHLGLAAFERRMQLRKLLRNETLVHTHSTTPTIIAGDFNDVWHNLGNGSLGEKEFRSALGTVKTFPAAYPIRCLDGIYYRGPIRKLRAFAGHTDVARQASDHLPAIAEFEIAPE
jgi:endonuclease/exonuclease/phosphatase family metal-dependent hydrolase